MISGRERNYYKNPMNRKLRMTTLQVTSKATDPN